NIDYIPRLVAFGIHEYSHLAGLNEVEVDFLERSILEHTIPVNRPFLEYYWPQILRSAESKLSTLQVLVDYLIYPPVARYKSDSAGLAKQRNVCTFDKQFVEYTTALESQPSFPGLSVLNIKQLRALEIIKLKLF